MIIRTDAEKASDKIQHLFMIIHNKLSIEEINFNLINAIYEKATANIILNDEELRSFPLRLETRHDAHSCHFYSP